MKKLKIVYYVVSEKMPTASYFDEISATAEALKRQSLKDLSIQIYKITYINGMQTDQKIYNY